jgi:hypothetical protein
MPENAANNENNYLSLARVTRVTAPKRQKLPLWRLIVAA